MLCAVSLLLFEKVSLRIASKFHKVNPTPNVQCTFRTRLCLQIRSLLIERWWVHVTCEIISCALPYKTNGKYLHNEVSVNFMVVQKFRKRQDGNTGGQFSSLWISSSELCHCCIPEISNASSSLLLPQKSERDNHSWTARVLELEDLRSSEHLCPYKQDGSDVFTTQELFYSAENEASKALTSTDPQPVQKFPMIFNAISLAFWV